MATSVKVFEILLPVLQVLAGGLIAILGAWVVQRRDHGKERNEFYRSKIEECYTLSLRADEAYSQEEQTLALLVKTKSAHPYIARKLEEGEEGNVITDRLQSMIALYLPKFSKCAREYQLAEAGLVYKKAEIYKDYKTLTEDAYESVVRKYFFAFLDKGLELRGLLSEEVKKYVP